LIYAILRLLAVLSRRSAAFDVVVSEGEPPDLCDQPGAALAPARQI
jgi:hypothetical protein